MLDSVRRGFRLLSSRDQRLLTLAVAVQVATSMLDLLGVLLIGVVAGLSMAILTGATPPASISSLLAWVGLDGTNLARVAIWIALAAGLILIAKTAINVFMTRRVLRFLARRQAMVAGRLIEALLAKPLIQVQQRSSQETAFSLTAGVGYAVLIVLGQATVAVAEIALLIVVGAGLLVVDPVLTAFAVAFFAFVGLIVYLLLGNWAGRLGRRSSTLDIDSYTTIQEAIATYRELWVGGRRQYYVDRVQGLRWNAAAVTSDLQFIGLVPKYAFEAALVLGAGVLAITQLTTKDASAAVALIAVYLAAGSRVVPSLLRMQGAVLSVRSAGASALPTLDLADELMGRGSGSKQAFKGPADQIDPAIHVRSGHPGFDPQVSLRGVQFTYPGADRPAVTGVSLDIREGRSIALVGSTGAGKSTLADLILGVLAPEVGTVRMGSATPLEAICAWPGAVAYVPQAIALTNGTVRQNVALGLSNAGVHDDLIWEALDRAHLGAFLREARDGLDTLVGERGIMLSGGQRQRVGIARALYTRPRLLVLDEATSALDAETEESIALTMQELEGSVTTVTVAHRLATIRHCDLVIYLEGGRIIAQGTFNEVREQSERFDAQARLLGMS